MASQLTRRATARIVAARPGDASGTAFLVSEARRFLVTARHCAEDAAGALLDRVALSFPDPDSEGGLARYHDTSAKVLKAGAAGYDNDDWALLEIDDPRGLPAWAKQLRLLRTKLLPRNPWSAFGYPDDPRGQPLAGEIALGGKLPQLYDLRLPGRPIAGASGAPLVVEEHAVGIIVRAERDKQGIAIDGTLYALLFEHLPALAAELAISCEPAFCERTTSEVKCGKGLPNVARAVWGLQAGDPIENIARIERLIALWLLREQTEGAIRVAREAALPRPEARNVVEFAACQWFSAAAAKELARRLVDGAPPRIISVESEDLALIARFVRRAGFEHGESVIWHEGHLRVPWMPGQAREELAAQLAAELLARITAANDASIELEAWALADESDKPAQLAALVGKAAAALTGWAKLPINMRDPACVFLSLLHHTPENFIAYVHGLFPELGIIVCGPPRAGAAPIVGGPSSADAELHRERFDAALRRLSTIHREGP